MNAMPTPQEAMTFMHQAVVCQWIDLAGAWEGWRVRGRDLVAPDGKRIPARRLEGLLWREEMELRRAGYASRRQAEKPRQPVRVVVVDLQDYREHGIAAA